MPYTLYGSKTSPFVRRLRILLEDIPYDFQELEIFGKDAELLNKINPLNQIPVLLDGEHTIWDSRQIINYLNVIHRFQNMSWEDENLLTAIEGAMTAGVNLLLLKRSGIDIQQPAMFIQRQHERIQSVLNYFSAQLSGVWMEEWNIHTVSMYCFLDWASFREIIDLSSRPECRAFLAKHSQRSLVIDTQIPRN
jgi:glutathione S-transferase